MKPPKRSPFLHARQAELLAVYRHLYPLSSFLPSNTSSPVDRHNALSTVQLWINRSACPFAVETTALLVQSVILDEHMQRMAASAVSSAAASTSAWPYALEQLGGGAELGVRLNYSLALTRFVNSVVDSHQTGGFAQSIAAIAARIGLPLWFVEIRHAVTHEELPSISVCRQAARAALVWLERHFWIPQLFDGPNALHLGSPHQHPHNGDAMDLEPPKKPSAAETSSYALSSSTAKDMAGEEEETRHKERRKALHDFSLTLKNYRQLAKQVTRDRSLVNSSKDQFRRLYKQFAVFVSKIRTLEPDFAAQLIDNAARFNKGKDEEVDVRTTVMDPDEVDECTKSALSDLVNQLIQPGGLIPLSKAKRVPSSATGDAVVLPAEVASLWTPLLGYLRDTFGPIFGQLLTEELVEAAVHVPGSPLLDPEVEAEASCSKPDADSASDFGASDPSSQAWKLAAFPEASYRKTAEAWIRYLVTTIPPSAQMHHSPSGARAPTTLITDVEVAQLCLAMRLHTSASLLEFLCERNEGLRASIGALVAVLKVAEFMQQAQEIEEEAPSTREKKIAGTREAGERGRDRGGDEEEIEVEVEVGEVSGFESQLELMQKRLTEMDAVTWSAPPDGNKGSSEANVVAAEEEGGSVGAGADGWASKMPTGWAWAGPEWKPTPLGCLNGKLPNLILDI